ncbi:LytTr DNA-binding domain protein [Streptococcus anginosus F0211]|uniref:LytTr DNA-binding domain protein n=2 Tax=Streptococcus TaxID=1301 RepID=E6IZH1_STRAP|nr:LytTr DNA-binding domain protein [Streptococcus anginosus F0211]EUB12232.1 LytTr DNA-binding domain protein [Streptococcus sp. ACC21]EUC77112.1 LytTr DNA-binding domain protein [Streptococcus sp. CM7]EWC97091.1 LytTr DNA-binding domain protein [Streptococcus sp. AC15]QBX12363.1 glutamate synthase [NADPH] large chain [Streptococcus satellite phage Javan72]QBX13403.1 glutamate synthase [NADPH] large chain [Streptococcus satellite phage Javan77]QBX13437.1 glutamate synthase [NADPH] large chai
MNENQQQTNIWKEGMFMKVQLYIDEKFSEEKVIIEAPALSDAIQQLMKFAQQLGKNKVIRAKKEEEIYLLDTAEIQRVYIENRQVWAETATGNYLLGLPLYQVLELLPTDFLQISQSEIINIKQIDHLKLTGSGLIQIAMKNGQITYSSRRYLKAIKEKLQL